MTKVTADYGTGNAKETAYVLNANGATTKQTLPSGHYNEFSYDDGGRVTNQVLFDSRKKEVETYAYNYSPTGLPSFTYGYTRTEKNGDVYTFVNDRMGRLKQEKKVNSGAVTQYQQDFTYDKNGNRLTMQQTGSGSGISSYTYTYTYDAQGKLTYIKDVARYYTGTITTDANGNITSVNEAWTGTANTWKTDFTFDYENRLNKISISVIAGGQTVVCNSVSHAYDGLNRLIKTTFASTNYGHIYDGNKLAGNANLTSSTNGTAWVNTANAAKPLASTQIQTVGATRYYNVSDERDPVRQVYTDAGTAGDTSQKSRYSEYKLIDGAAPTMVTYGGAIKQSELFRVRNITLNENSIVLPSANGSFEAAAISLNYEGTRVKSALIGRDLNPMGRGDGVYYFAGAVKSVAILNSFGTNQRPGTGNSANNCGQCGNNDKTMPAENPYDKDFSDEYVSPYGNPRGGSSGGGGLGSTGAATDPGKAGCYDTLLNCYNAFALAMEPINAAYQVEYKELKKVLDNFDKYVEDFKKAHKAAKFAHGMKKDAVGTLKSHGKSALLDYLDKYKLSQGDWDRFTRQSSIGSPNGSASDILDPELINWDKATEQLIRCHVRYLEYDIPLRKLDNKYNALRMVACNNYFTCLGDCKKYSNWGSCDQYRQQGKPIYSCLGSAAWYDSLGWYPRYAWWMITENFDDGMNLPDFKGQ